MKKLLTMEEGAKSHHVDSGRRSPKMVDARIVVTTNTYLKMEKGAKIKNAEKDKE
jgi:hypothetical protein